MEWPDEITFETFLPHINSDFFQKSTLEKPQTFGRAVISVLRYNVDGQTDVYILSNY
jgi:hypothetical protein